jgi:hypothetical protein
LNVLTWKIAFINLEKYSNLAGNGIGKSSFSSFSSCGNEFKFDGFIVLGTLIEVFLSSSSFSISS